MVKMLLSFFAGGDHGGGRSFALFVCLTMDRHCGYEDFEQNSDPAMCPEYIVPWQHCSLSLALQQPISGSLDGDTLCSVSPALTKSWFSLLVHNPLSCHQLGPHSYPCTIISSGGLCLAP